MRQLATIQIIKDIQPIPGADQIEVATILGWQVVVKKGEFKIGDFCVYCEIDSILPETSWSEFLRERKFRIKTIKLRKQVSQGIVFPLSILSGYGATNFKVMTGVDVTEPLGIKKYDPQGDNERVLMEQMEFISNNRIKRYLSRFKWYRNLFFKPNRLPFPNFISKTDETRIQNIPAILNNTEEFIVTEKLDGQSATYFILKNKGWFKTKYKFGVCSRNFQLLKKDNSSYWTIAEKYNIEQELLKLIKAFPYNTFIAVQGEIIGSGIQGNKYNIQGYDFYLFNLIGDNLIKMIGLKGGQIVTKHGMKFVPVLELNYKIKSTMQENVEYSKGYSILNNKTLREGVVVRNNNRSFKIINPDFLLKNDE